MARSCRFLLLTALLLSGCGVERRYAVLSFLFDGVPKPGESVDAESEEDFGRGIRRKLTPTVPAVPHQPFKERKCDSCHPDTRAYYVAKNADRTGLCYSCHEHEPFKETLERYPFLHGPTALQACLACHRPHDSRHPALARAADPQLCYRCHERDDVLSGKKYHVLGEETCLPCHDPHGGTDKYYLKQTEEP